MTLVEDIRANVNDILGIRDSLGAVKEPVYLVTRSWSGDELGDGSFSDEENQMLPSPRIVELTNQYRVKEGGTVHNGDIMLKGVSQQTYPTQDLLDSKPEAQNIERLYKVGEIYYTVLRVEKKYVTWNVWLRRKSK